ncbi:MAG TPA: SET domain-containing protein [Kiritimatiellia bacterium]|nr:SET domain-containing protein [Kiritimatiellia bacterium]HMO99903.1 SET domain-containing protein [Kiritimatiellia bacterium]HMP96044.1 SET domain-containing protein [Kiritimatiellia bacterium]
MLLVNARKGSSKIHGQGLIAQEFIPKGTRIWEFRAGYDNTFTPEQLMALPQFARQQALYYSYFDPRTRVYVMSGDDDRHTNHSNTPNSMLDADGDSTVAARDIPAGEEITWDYRPFGGTDYHLNNSSILPHQLYES